jgi:uncharacterized membrane protein
MSTSGTEVAKGEVLDEGMRLVVPGRALPAGNGWDWIAKGWGLFTRAPLMWIVALVILFVIAIVSAFVPFLGSLAFQVCQPVFAAGLIYACRALERGGEFELEHVFAGFTKRFVPLLIVGLVFMIASIIVMLVFFVIVGLSLIPAFLTGDQDAMMAALAGSVMVMLLGTLVTLALFVPILAAYWFAPALVMMHDMAPMAAMKESFFACFRNFFTFFVYSLVMMVFAIIAVIPFGLGMLVWVPLAITSTYVAYRQIFTEDTAAEAPKPTMA